MSRLLNLLASLRLMRMPESSVRLLASAAAIACILLLRSAATETLYVVSWGLLLLGVLMSAIPVLMGVRFSVTALLGVLGGPLLLLLQIVPVLGLLLGFLELLAILATLGYLLWYLFWRTERRPLHATALKATVGLGTALLWPLPIVSALSLLYASLTDIDYAALAVLAMPFVLGPLIGRMETSRRLYNAYVLIDLRNVLVRVGGASAAALAALWLANTVQQSLQAVLTNTPIEAAINVAAWCAGVIAVIVMLWVLWRLPALLCAGLLRGTLHRSAVAESLWFIALSAIAAVIYDSMQYFSGVASSLWVAAAAAYSLVRLALSMPIANGNAPLWLVALDRPSRADRIAASRLAAAWKAGPATLLALPEAAHVLADVHLRTCRTAGQLGQLFPQRIAQLTDWDRGLPEPRAWSTLPLLELYAPAHMWNEILSTRVAPSSHVVAIEAAHPATLFAVEPRTFAIAPSNARRLHPAIDTDELRSLAASESSSVEELIAEFEALRRARKTCRVVLLYSPQDAELAKALCEALGTMDDLRATGVETWRIPMLQVSLLEKSIRALIIGLSRQSFALLFYLLLRQPRSFGWVGRYVRMLFKLFDVSAACGHHLVILEPGKAAAKSRQMTSDMLSFLAAQGAFDSVIGVHSAHNDPEARFFEPELYSVRMQWQSGSAPAERAKDMAERLVAHLNAQTSTEPDEMAEAQPDLSAGADLQVATHNEAGERSQQVANGFTLLPHAEPLVFATYRADGAEFVTTSRDATARTWDGHGNGTGIVLAHEASIRHAQYSPDGTHIVTCGSDAAVRLWDASSGQCLGVMLGHEAPVTHVCFSPDGTRIVSAGDLTARIWDTSSLENLAVMRHEATIVRAVFSPDGRLILSSSMDNTARLWDARNAEAYGQPLRHIRTVRYAAFNPEGSLIVTASDDRSARLWDTSSCEPVGSIIRHEKAIKRAVFSPDARMIATASDDGTARLWDGQYGQQMESMPMLHPGSVNCVAFNHVGSVLATACEDGCARLWDVFNGSQIAAEIQLDGPVTYVTFSPNGEWLLAVDGSKAGKLWRSDGAMS